MKLAQVIVDVPAMQTDQPFSYLIPPQLAVEVGMRVEVGFGSRHVQGFVGLALRLHLNHYLTI